MITQKEKSGNRKLSEIRISNALEEKMKQALQTLNSNEAGIQIKLIDFRRWAYKFFSEQIITSGIVLEFPTMK